MTPERERLVLVVETGRDYHDALLILYASRDSWWQTIRGAMRLARLQGELDRDRRALAAYDRDHPEEAK